MSYYSQLIPITEIPNFNRRRVNGHLSPSRNQTNLAMIGSPRSSYGKKCQKPENPNFIAMIETRDFGPFQARGLRPAIRTLGLIMEEVAAHHPDLFKRLGTEGMLCCRHVRGAPGSISNHSWGTAIDLTIDGATDQVGDDKVQRGLLDLWPIFNKHGFYWGIAFPREDAMHFEASEQLVMRWAKEGEFGHPSGRRLTRAVTLGDRSIHVLQLQQALNAELAPMAIAEDGIFGTQTRIAVMELQRRLGLKPDGTGNKQVLDALRMGERLAIRPEDAA